MEQIINLNQCTLKRSQLFGVLEGVSALGGNAEHEGAVAVVNRRGGGASPGSRCVSKGLQGVRELAEQVSGGECTRWRTANTGRPGMLRGREEACVGGAGLGRQRTMPETGRSQLTQALGFDVEEDVKSALSRDHRMTGF